MIQTAKEIFVPMFTPNQVVSKKALQITGILWATGFILFWLTNPIVVIPKPQEILSAFVTLWTIEGLADELMTSFLLNLKALSLTVLISLALSYLTVLPGMRPVAALVTKFRFLGLVGLSFLFTVTIGGGHRLKVSLLVFGMTVFFVTSMAAEVASIPKERFDYARTLRMGEWRVVWEVVILGKIDTAIEVMRQNAAMGWMMLTMVEGISRSEGGVGALLLNQNKHLHLAAVFAVQISILLLGLLQDVSIGFIQKKACPYAYLSLERR